MDKADIKKRVMKAVWKQVPMMALATVVMAALLVIVVRLFTIALPMLWQFDKLIAVCFCVIVGPGVVFLVLKFVRNTVSLWRKKFLAANIAINMKAGGIEKEAGKPAFMPTEEFFEALRHEGIAFEGMDSLMKELEKKIKGKER